MERISIMSTEHTRLTLPQTLITQLDIIAEEFEVGAAELLRLGAMDPLKMIISSTVRPEVNPNDLGILGLHWPKSLYRRIRSYSRETGHSLEAVVEQILWSMVRCFPEGFDNRLRENPTGTTRIKSELESSDGWW